MSLGLPRVFAAQYKQGQFSEYSHIVSCILPTFCVNATAELSLAAISLSQMTHKPDTFFVSC